jgi:hypothetical protein
MEDFGARDELPADLCRRRVAACDLIVILAGPAYGSIGPTGTSYTEDEYDTAQAFGKPCLVFLTTDDFPVPASAVETDRGRRKQDAFRRKIAGRTVERFGSCVELSTKVVQAIRNWEASPVEHSIVRVRRDGAKEALEFRRPFLRFGRDPDIEVAVLDDSQVSRAHGMVFKHAGLFYYRHLSRTNVSCLTTGERDVMLRPDDQQEVALGARNQLRIGNTTLHIEVMLFQQPGQFVATDKQDE